MENDYKKTRGFDLESVADPMCFPTPTARQRHWFRKCEPHHPDPMGRGVDDQESLGCWRPWDLGTHVPLRCESSIYCPDDYLGTHGGVSLTTYICMVRLSTGRRSQCRKVLQIPAPRVTRVRAHVLPPCLPRRPAGAPVRRQREQ